MKKKRLEYIIKAFPLIIFIISWEIGVHNSQRLTFLFGSPVLVFKCFWNEWKDFTILFDVIVTGGEAVIGFIIGNIAGTILGLLISYYNRFAEVSKPYIIGLGSVPIFAIAPMMIIWFGVGFTSKVMMAVFSTILIALLQAFTGATQLDRQYEMLFKAFGATKRQLYIKAIVPNSLAWVIASLKITIGFSLLGAFIGEFISSERGLGHLILKAGGLYNIPLVIVGVLHIIAIALMLSWIVGKIEHRLLRWKHPRIQEK
jgi:NitT/TauT family transport system permease protein